MFRTLVASAIASALVLGFSAPAFADGGGGRDSAGEMTLTHPNGNSVTGQFRRDGSRTDTYRDANGNITKVNEKGPRKPKPVKVKAPKPPRAAKPKSRPWASAYDPATGTRTTSIGNDNGTRTVITFGPFGIGIGISR